MKNQEMSAYPCPPMNGCAPECGETKFEKAFWQVYSSMLSNVNLNHVYIANDALKAVHAGFKVLENNNKQRTI